MTLYMFRTVFQSIIRSSKLYIQQQAYVRYCYLLASGKEMELQLHLHLLPASKQVAVSDICLLLYVQF